MTVTTPAVPTAPNDYTVRTVPNVLTGAVYPTAPCMGSSQVGGAGVGFGFSVGTSSTSSRGIRETARSFSGMGLKDDALAVLCTSKYAAATQLQAVETAAGPEVTFFTKGGDTASGKCRASAPSTQGAQNGRAYSAEDYGYRRLTEEETALMNKRRGIC